MFSETDIRRTPSKHRTDRRKAGIAFEKRGWRKGGLRPTTSIKDVASRLRVARLYNGSRYRKMPNFLHEKGRFA